MAGEVIKVGAGVTGFRPGDRVLGFAIGTDKKRNSTSEGAFQQVHVLFCDSNYVLNLEQYTVLLTHLTSVIPSTMSFEEATVIPLGLSTAASALFQKEQFGLQYPGAEVKPTGKTLVVWGGSTSVGSNAIQLAVAAGYEVFATSSPRNFEYVKKLGATEAFDTMT